MKALNLICKYKFGGGEKVASCYSKILNELGCCTQILGISDARIPEDDSVILVKNKLSYFYFIFKNYNKYDFIFCHCNLSFMITLVIKTIKGEKDKKFIYVQHLEYSRKKRVLIYKLINSFFDYYIEIKSKSYKEITLINEKKILHIHNFSLIDNDNIQDDLNVKKVKKLKQLGYKLFLFVGAVKHGKGVNHLIEIAKYLNKIKSKYKIIFVGDGPMLSAFKNNVEILKLNDNFLFCGYCEKPNIYMQLSDVLLFTSDISEVTPMVVIEALDNKLPVLAFEFEFNKRYLPSDCLFDIDDYSNIALYLNRGDYFSIDCHYNHSYALNKFKTFLELGK